LPKKNQLLRQSVHQERRHRALALHIDAAPARERVGRVVLDDIVHLLRHLNVVQHARRVHAARDIHGITPDVILRFAGPDHAGHYRAHVDADSHAKVVERVLVDVDDLLEQLERVIDHRVDVRELELVAGVAG
jgi:hypothetical protein